MNSTTYSTKTTNRILLIITALSIIIIYSIFSWLVPFNIDDLLFSHKYLVANNGDEQFSLTAIWVYIRDIWLYENGRLANMLCAPIVLWTPKWLWAISLGIIIMAIYVLSACLAQSSSRISASLLMFIWLMGIIFYPWHDMSSLMFVDYALNYFVAGLLILISIAAFVYLETHKLRPAVYIPLIITGITAGMIHEGFSLPLCATLVIASVTNQGKQSRQWWGLFIAVVAGTVICTTSPAVWARFFETAESKKFMHYIIPYVRLFIKNTPLFAAGLFVTVILLITRKGRIILKKVFADRLNVYLATMTFAASTMAIILLAPPRATLCGDITAIILIARILNNYTHFFLICSSILLNIIALIFIYIFYAGVIYWQFQISKEDRIIKQMLMDSNGDTVYYDTIRFTPWWTFQHPTAGIWETTMQYDSFGLYTGRMKSSALVLPRDLENYDLSTFHSIPESEGMFQKNDYFIISDSTLISLMSAPNIRPKNTQCRFILEDGRNVGSPVTLFPFLTHDNEIFLIGFPSKDNVKGPFRKVSDNTV